jgi:transcriptional regulator with GAF, ATPase, and Fis domain
LKPIDESSSFRADLYARISAFVHPMPTLRERIGDLGLIVADLLPRLAPERAEKVRFAPDLATALVSHHYRTCSSSRTFIGGAARGCRSTAG